MKIEPIHSFIDTGINDAEKLSKLLDLETGICDLKNMSNILLTLIEALAPQANKGASDGFVNLLLTRDQWDAIDFGAGQVATMARSLDQAFVEACRNGAAA